MNPKLIVVEVSYKAPKYCVCSQGGNWMSYIMNKGTPFPNIQTQYK